MAKQPQKIKGCYFRLDVIPDTFEEFINLHGKTSTFEGLTNEEILENYLQLNPDYEFNTVPNKSVAKSRKGKKSNSECNFKD